MYRPKTERAEPGSSGRGQQEARLSHEHRPCFLRVWVEVRPHKGSLVGERTTTGGKEGNRSQTAESEISYHVIRGRLIEGTFMLGSKCVLHKGRLSMPCHWRD